MMSSIWAELRQHVPAEIPSFFADLYAALPARLLSLAYGRVAGEVDRERGLVVELGCGPGWLARALGRSHPDLRVEGVDVSRRMTEIAQSHTLTLPNVRIRQMDIHSLDYQDGQVDLFLSMGVLSLVEGVEVVLAELHRCLRPGGQVMLYEWMGQADPRAAAAWFPFPLSWEPLYRLLSPLMSVVSPTLDEHKSHLLLPVRKSPFGQGRLEPWGPLVRLVLSKGA